MPRNEGQVLIENAKFKWRTNFAGLKTKFKAEGYRTFTVLLPPDLGEQMLADGWNVKITKERFNDQGETVDEGGEYTLEVHVDYGYEPERPRVVMLGEQTGSRSQLGDGNPNFPNEGDVGLLDDMEISHVDMMIRPYRYDVNGTKGIKAKLKTIYVTIVEDFFMQKYGPAGGQNNLEPDPDEI